MFACMKIGLMCKVYQPEWSILVSTGRAGMHEKGSAPLTFVWPGLAIDVAATCMHGHASINQRSPGNIFYSSPS